MDHPIVNIADLTSLAIDVCDFLDRAQIPYALTGGIALSVWGYPRSTIDVDLVLAVSSQSLNASLNSADPQTPFIMEPDELVFPHMKVYRGLMRRMPESAEWVMVDMLIVDPSWSAEIMTRRQTVQLEQRSIWVCSPEDIILLKLFSPRDKDREDIRMLMQLRKDRLDTAYIADWSTRLGTSNRWLALTSTPTPQSPAAGS